MSILNLKETPLNDNSIESYEVHTYNAYNDSYRENDEIRIPIHQQDLYVLPSASSIYIEGSVKVYGKDETGKMVSKDYQPTNNFLLYLFQEIRYELNGIEIDRIKNAGITSTMKSYVSLGNNETKHAEIWGWKIGGVSFDNNKFSGIIPLNKILGFAEDYEKILINCKHELILIRSSTNLNSFSLKSNNDICEVTLQRIQWRIPHIKVSDRERLTLLKQLEKDIPIKMTFRNWDLYEYPTLPTTTKHSWAVKTSSQLEKPRYIIFGLQTSKKNNKTADSSLFDHCKVMNIKLFLNSQSFPYETLNLNFSDNKFNIIYDMYSKFRHSYYNLPVDPLLDRDSFKSKAPLFVIDCSRQNDSLKTGPVDVRLEVETSETIPTDTTAYCLIFNDRIFEYRPLSSIVRKLS